MNVNWMLCGTTMMIAIVAVGLLVFLSKLLLVGIREYGFKWHEFHKNHLLVILAAAIITLLGLVIFGTSIVI